MHYTRHSAKCFLYCVSVHLFLTMTYDAGKCFTFAQSFFLPLLTSPQKALGSGTRKLVLYFYRKIMLTWRNYIEEILEFIHPHFCKSSVVFVNNLSCASWECVRCSFPKHMSNMWASDNLQSSSTLPNLRATTQKTSFKHWPKRNVLTFTEFTAGVSKKQGHRAELLLYGYETSAASGAHLYFWFWLNQRLKGKLQNHRLRAKCRKDTRSRSSIFLAADRDS